MTSEHPGTAENRDEPATGQVSAESVNASISYAMWSVFAAVGTLGPEREPLVSGVRAALHGLPGVSVRGWYDVSGFRADADVMVWWYGADPRELQAAYHGLLHSPWGKHLEPVWSQVGLHRPAEFNRSHVPAFLSGEPPKEYLCLYPFVRSYEWYLLPEQERRELLREHGEAARDYKDVLANTVSSFALGDYEWLLAFEADELHRIVDLMRQLRATGARRHVREEIPFYTGPRVELSELVSRLP
ncbi:MAG: hypothetical protein CSA58_06815 [Micrococcales bacterium]|nr:MAG: hypothetical protein CSA58_06815 [Micrococcales bacterium]